MPESGKMVCGNYGQFNIIVGSLFFWTSLISLLNLNKTIPLSFTCNSIPLIKSSTRICMSLTKFSQDSATNYTHFYSLFFFPLYILKKRIFCQGLFNGFSLWVEDKLYLQSSNGRPRQSKQ